MNDSLALNMSDNVSSIATEDESFFLKTDIKYLSSIEGENDNEAKSDSEISQDIHCVNVPMNSTVTKVGIIFIFLVY